ncbi:hypothetical protein IV38_GL000103 [Lactobacillus selangorensis]|uniref:Uncharacterized protein n=2 Tax=Lactobacillus selangorensis TaxID=81857 RepID=A0A0R2FUW7_9LACO|nr:hypothetical protein IV38_GL000103 [Lactobacillus selangorensis]KRN31419.1 hypothetical protein IV40_GL001415 [Lactobacillus selangorensis]
MSLYRYQKANPDFVSKKARWKKGLKGRAKMAIAMKIFGGDSKTSQWYIEHEERAEMNKANVKRLQAETKRTLAEAQMAEYKAKILEGGRSTDINIQIGGDDDSN